MYRSETQALICRYRQRNPDFSNLQGNENWFRKSGVWDIESTNTVKQIVINFESSGNRNFAVSVYCFSYPPTSIFLYFFLIQIMVQEWFYCSFCWTQRLLLFLLSAYYTVTISSYCGMWWVLTLSQFSILGDKCRYHNMWKIPLPLTFNSPWFLCLRRKTLQHLTNSHVPKFY